MVHLHRKSPSEFFLKIHTWFYNILQPYLTKIHLQWFSLTNFYDQRSTLGLGYRLHPCHQLCSRSFFHIQSSFPLSNHSYKTCHCEDAAFFWSNFKCFNDWCDQVDWAYSLNFHLQLHCPWRKSKYQQRMDNLVSNEHSKARSIFLDVEGLRHLWRILRDLNLLFCSPRYRCRIPIEFFSSSNFFGRLHVLRKLSHQKLESIASLLCCGSCQLVFS